MVGLRFSSKSSDNKKATVQGNRGLENFDMVRSLSTYQPYPPQFACAEEVEIGERVGFA